MTTAGGIASGISFTYVAIPAINTINPINPVAGTTSGGTSVTIFGQDLSNPQYVLFGITAGTGLVSNAGGATLIAFSPSSLSTGLVDISVHTAGGTGTATNVYTYLGPIIITSITPNRGPTGGG